MTDKLLIDRELLPCPFCGDTPVLPSGDGTQYEIECGGCGQAMASVQICDLMTFEERAADTFTDYRYGEEFVERAKVQAIERWNNRAPSPAGVDADHAEDARAMVVPAGEAVAYRVSLPSEPELGHWFDEFAESAPQMCQHEPLMTIAQHQRILAQRDAEVERLRGEVERWKLTADAGNANELALIGERTELRTQLDHANAKLSGTIRTDNSAVIESLIKELDRANTFISSVQAHLCHWKPGSRKAMDAKNELATALITHLSQQAKP